MPKLIDHQAREREIAAAAFTVLERDGLAALTVRGVAAEADLAVASLRRAFPTQDALRRFCLSMVRERAADRVSAIRGEGIGVVIALLEALLPLDHARRVEAMAQLQLIVLATTDQTLRDVADSLNDGVREVCGGAIAELHRVGLLSADTDLSQATAELHAFLDGLAFQALLTAETPEQIQARLRQYVARLTR